METYPADAVLEKAVQDMFPTQYRMSDQPPQKVLEQSLPARNHCRIFLGFRLALDGIVGQRLFGRNGRDDEYRVQAGEGLVQAEKGRVPAARLV